jgi:hypothetical protein
MMPYSVRHNDWPGRQSAMLRRGRGHLVDDLIRVNVLDRRCRRRGRKGRRPGPYKGGLPVSPSARTSVGSDIPQDGMGNFLEAREAATILPRVPRVPGSCSTRDPFLSWISSFSPRFLRAPCWLLTITGRLLFAPRAPVPAAVIAMLDPQRHTRSGQTMLWHPAP